MSEFKIPPISTLIGSNLINFIKVLRNGGRIDPGNYFKLALTLIVIILATPFHIWEYLYFRKKIRDYEFKREPLFILGHWRSGTTLLHNMLCSEPNAGYLTTYHSVFPNNLASGFIFKSFMKMNMPEKRPSDNVKLGVNLPQEDEFALANLTTKSFYHFFYFPEEYSRFYNESVTSVNHSDVNGWDKDYKNLIVKALIYSRGERAVLKNPVNTARIPALLRIFPNAKFLFIYRNPVIVYLSTRKFFYELFPTLWFHKVEREFIDSMIFENFTRFMDDYEKQKSLIPPGNLKEIKFEDFERDPLNECRSVYETLLNADFTEPAVHFNQFLKLQKGYTKNTYNISATTLDRINMHWGGYMEKWKYELPTELVVDVNS